VGDETNNRRTYQVMPWDELLPIESKDSNGKREHARKQ